MISLVPSESWGVFKWVWASARSLGVWGRAPPGAFGRAAASPQTRQMRCWPSSERTTNPSSRRKRLDSLSLSLVLFPPKPLRWVSAGALLGAVIKTPVLHFFDTSVRGRYHYPRRSIHAVETLDARRSRRRIRRFCAAAMFALRVRNSPRQVHTPPRPLTAHTAAHTAKHGGFSGSMVTMFSVVGSSAPSALFRQIRRSPLLLRKDTVMPFRLRASTL